MLSERPAVSVPVEEPLAPTAEASPDAVGLQHRDCPDSPLERIPYEADWSLRPAEESTVAAAAVVMRPVAAAAAAVERMMVMLQLQVQMTRTPGCSAPATRSSLSLVLIVLHRQTDRQTNSQTHRKTNRQKDNWTDGNEKTDGLRRQIQSNKTCRREITLTEFHMKRLLNYAKEKLLGVMLQVRV